MRTHRLNIVFSDDVARELREIIPEGKRSQVVNEATRKELQRIKRKGEFENLLRLRKGASKVPPGEIVKVLRELRRGRQ
ncbi:MAG TPA: hypothetical protein VGL91_11980 [Acidobacteriota bacterium]